jgi:hypothetical protein
MGAVTILILAHFAVALAVLWPVIPPLLYGFFNFPHSRTQVIGAFLVFLFCSGIVLPGFSFLIAFSRSRNSAGALMRPNDSEDVNPGISGGRIKVPEHPVLRQGVPTGSSRPEIFA